MLSSPLLWANCEETSVTTLTVVDSHLNPCVQIESLCMVAIATLAIPRQDGSAVLPFSGLFSDLIERFILASNGMRLRRKLWPLVFWHAKRRDVTYG